MPVFGNACGDQFDLSLPIMGANVDSQQMKTTDWMQKAKAATWLLQYALLSLFLFTMPHIFIVN